VAITTGGIVIQAPNARLIATERIQWW